MLLGGFECADWGCRDRYTLEDLIGGERHRFVIGSCQGIREDLELVSLCDLVVLLGVY